MTERMKVLSEQPGSPVVGTAEVLVAADVQELLQQLRTSAPTLIKTMRQLDDLSRSGALDTLLELVEVVQVFRVSMSDGMVSKLGTMVRQLGEVADTLLTSGLPEQVPALVQAVGDARADAEKDPSTIGVMGLLRALRDSKVQFSLKFLLALARRLPEATK